MSFVSSAGIQGPQDNKQAFDVGGVNHADTSRRGPGGDAANFSELLNESIGKSSQVSSDIGQATPLGRACAAATNKTSGDISRENIVYTGTPLDLAINGEGCWVLTDGTRDSYTATGSFAVDSNLNIVDPATGYHFKRIGTDGEADGFKAPGNSSIRVPCFMPLPPRATTEVAISGNLSAGTSFSNLSTAFVKTDSPTPGTWFLLQIAALRIRK